MLLDDARPARHRRNGDVDSRRVVGQADRQAELVRQRIHRAQVGLGRWCRVLGRAMEQAHLFAQHRLPRLGGKRGAEGIAAGPGVGRRGKAEGEDTERSLDLRQRRHAGGHDDARPQTGDLEQQRRIGDLAGGDLDGLQCELAGEKANAWQVERRRQEGQPALLRACEQRPVIRFA